MWGLTLRHGWGVTKSEPMGFKWLKKAAEIAVVDLESARGGMDVKGVKDECLAELSFSEKETDIYKVSAPAAL